MKRFCLMILVLLQIPCKADNFVIKAMNVAQIRIGDTVCKVGSEFSGDDVIYWSDDKVEIIEAQNTRTKKIWQFTKKNLKNSRSGNAGGFCDWIAERWGTFENYFFNIARLSSREAEFYDRDEYIDIALTREFNLADSIKVDTRSTDADGREYFASYYSVGEKKTVPLSLVNGTLIFSRDQFVSPGMKLPKKLVLTVFYIRDGLYSEVTDGMCVTLVEPPMEGSSFVFQ